MLKWTEFGRVKPQGWIRNQMEKDLKDGFVGSLDQLVPELIVNDDIYDENRLSMHVKSKDVGAIADSGNWEVQFLWWNSETQSNWRDGLVRHALLLDEKVYIDKAKVYIDKILATQDSDGYLGIYDSDLRYNFTGENGELWAQSSLFRMLLAYYEATHEDKVYKAVVKAMDKTMESYPMYQSRPFDLNNSFAGVAHGLTITDTLNRLYDLSKDTKYLEYALWLFEEYNRSDVSEKDILLKNLLNPEYLFQGHGVHTYEHLRALIIAYDATKKNHLDEMKVVSDASDDEKYKQALNAYLSKLQLHLTPSGGPIGDEWVFGHTADASKTAYEYCSIHELLDSYTLLMQKTGDYQWGDQIEWLLFNASQGAKHPDESGICYLKKDNAYSLVGKKEHDQILEDDETQTRYRYSPTHKEAAVCCVPNAGRILPYYTKAMWFETSKGVAATLYGPCTYSGNINGSKVTIEEITDYPFQDSIRFNIDVEVPTNFTLTLRKPKWSVDVEIKSENSIIVIDDACIQVTKCWSSGDAIELKMIPKIEIKTDLLGEQYITRGPLLYALPIESSETVTKEFDVEHFKEIQYLPKNEDYKDLYITSDTIKDSTIFIESSKSEWDRIKMQVPLFNKTTLSTQRVDFVPFGKTILRRVTFPFFE